MFGVVKLNARQDISWAEFVLDAIFGRKVIDQ